MRSQQEQTSQAGEPPSRLFSALSLPSYHSDRAEKSILLLDTDVLSAIAKESEAELLAERYVLERGGTLAFSHPNIFELGFGANGQPDRREIEFCKKLYVGKSVIPHHPDSTELHFLRFRSEPNFLQSQWIGISPSADCWYAARHCLIEYMNSRRASPRNARKLQMDTLLAVTAWNSRAFVWSNNVKDFVLVYYMILRAQYHHLSTWRELVAYRMPPVFSTDSLLSVLTDSKVNIYDRMKGEVTDQELLGILSEVPLQ